MSMMICTVGIVRSFVRMRSKKIALRLKDIGIASARLQIFEIFQARNCNWKTLITQRQLGNGFFYFVKITLDKFYNIGVL